MATQFPGGLDSFLNPQPTDSVQLVSHAAQHANANDAIEALQSKVGVDNSLDPNSLDYKVRALENASLDTEGIQDIVAALIGSGSHTNISVVYDDDNNKLNFSASLDSEEAMDAIAAAFTAGTGILKAYDDELNTITISVDTSTIATQQFATDAASAALTDANEYTDIAIAGLGNQIGENYVPISAVGNIDGVAQLDENGFVPQDQLDIDERIQDVASTMITSATHSGISVSYDDNTGRLSFTGNSSGTPLTQEEIQDYVAPLLNHAFHTNISVTYDDDNNRLVLQGNSGGGGGASVIISPTPPSTPGLGDIWLDSDNSNTYIWDGQYWVEVGAGTAQAVAAVLATPPSNPVLGTIWMNTSTAKTYIYDGSYWAEI